MKSSRRNQSIWKAELKETEVPPLDLSDPESWAFAEGTCAPGFAVCTVCDGHPFTNNPCPVCKGSGTTWIGNKK